MQRWLEIRNMDDNDLECFLHRALNASYKEGFEDGLKMAVNRISKIEEMPTFCPRHQLNNHVSTCQVEQLDIHET